MICRPLITESTEGRAIVSTLLPSLLTYVPGLFDTGAGCCLIRLW